MKDTFNYQQIRYQTEPEVASGTLRTMNANYPEVFNGHNNSHASILQEKDPKYTSFVYYLAVSSASRDPTNYPLHYDFHVNLDTVYKNVKTVELISAILPNQPAEILDEPFLSIDIEELNHIDFASTNVNHQAFAVLPLKASTKATGGFINPELGSIYHTTLTYHTPLAKLSSLGIKIRDMNGNLFDFGQPAGSMDKAYQTNLIFKIGVEEMSRAPLNHRNVF